MPTAMPRLHSNISVDELRDRWEWRDRRYRRRRTELSDEEVASIRAARSAELGYVNPHQRSAAFTVLMGWRPPAPSSRRA